MQRHPLRTILSIIIPAGLAAAAELPQMAPTPSQEPVARSLQGTRLIDEVVPNFGTMNYRPARRDSSIEELVNRISTFSASLDSKVLAGEVSRPRQHYEMGVDERGYPIATPNTREPLPQETELLVLLQELAVVQEKIPFPNSYEEWHLDQAWSNLQRSAQLLRVGLSEDAYLHLEEIHASWVTYYHQSIAKAQAEYALELVEAGESVGSALNMAKEKVADVAYPKMSLTGDYPPLVIPLVVPPPKAPEVEPEPVAVPEPAAPEPAPMEPVMEPAPAPAAPEVAPEPEPAPSLPAAPMPDASSVDQLALARALYEKGAGIYAQAVEQEDFDQRDQLYNEAELILGEAVQAFGTLVDENPDDAGLGEEMRKANQLRYGSVKQARKSAQGNAKAEKNAKSAVADVMAGLSGGAAVAEPMPEPEPVVEEPMPMPEPEPMVEELVPEPESVVEEPMPEPEPVVEEPMPEPEPVVEEPMPEPEPVVEEPVAEPEPVVEEPAAEPEADKAEVDEAVEALDDLDWPDL
ncbi:MAG: hypothetical protein PF961_03215 [Planctomycetota bacterium]|jgi:outer membrane biosynthesis protein TonB|nr:hypothetical protein [Planctomycetota bacterium]